MNLKITSAEVDTDAKVLKVALEVLIDLSDSNRSYRMQEDLIKEVTKQLTPVYIEKNEESILAGVNIDSIIKRIQIAAVNNYGARQ